MYFWIGHDWWKHGQRVAILAEAAELAWSESYHRWLLLVQSVERQVDLCLKDLDALARHWQRPAEVVEAAC